QTYLACPHKPRAPIALVRKNCRWPPDFPCRPAAAKPGLDNDWHNSVIKTAKHQWNRHHGTPAVNPDGSGTEWNQSAHADIFRRCIPEAAPESDSWQCSGIPDATTNLLPVFLASVSKTDQPQGLQHKTYTVAHF